jgi:acetoin utilization deacetylase AcuC-like enzyme
VNIPWAECGTTDADYIHAFQQIVMPIATEFAPELVISKFGNESPAGNTLNSWQSQLDLMRPTVTFSGSAVLRLQGMPT